jgi:hypothetical protein
LIRKFSGIEDLFTNHKHLVWYETNEEAEKLAAYYLGHEEEREKIALEGMKYVHENALNTNLFLKWLNTDSGNGTKKSSFEDRISDYFWANGHKIGSSLINTKIGSYLRSNL